MPLDYRFTYEQEIGPNSTSPHVPGGNSGVTIGPGYDMGSRQPEQVVQQLTVIGVDRETAEALSQAAGLKGAAAAEWAQANQHLKITEEQQETLFREVLVPIYEQSAINYVSTQYNVYWNDLSDAQKSLLFDYHYNPGLSTFPNFTKAVIDEDWQTVASEYERFSNGQPLGRNEAVFEEYIRENITIDNPIEILRIDDDIEPVFAAEPPPIFVIEPPPTLVIAPPEEAIIPGSPPPTYLPQDITNIPGDDPPVNDSSPSVPIEVPTPYDNSILSEE